ncbi:endoplasmic reticulum protein [Pelomyxa schiedti]|nr:endoplasmic reticulum protein [Pelomyxa schiedti]
MLVLVWLVWFLIGFVAGSGFLFYVAYRALFMATTMADADLQGALSARDRAARKLCDKRQIKYEPGLAVDPSSSYPGNSGEELQGWVRVRWDRVSPDEPPLEWLVLKSDMLLCFPHEGAKESTSSISLEGCSVSLFRAKHSKYHKDNSLHLECKTHELFRGCHECWIFCEYGIDLEKWHHALAKATHQVTPNLPKILSHFSTLIGNVGYALTGVSSSASMQIRDPNILRQMLAPVNAGFHRLFWGVHDNPTTLEFLASKVNKKFNRLHLPSFVTGLRVKKLELGPNLPVALSVDLISLTPSGELIVDAEFMYTGGFNISIELQIDVTIPVVKHHVNIPLVITVALNAVAGKVRVHCLGPPSQRLWVGFHSEPVFEVSIDTQVGAMSRVEVHQIPKLANIVIAKIKAQLIEQVVLPNMDDWPLPRPPKVKSAPSTNTSTAAAGLKIQLQKTPPLPPKPTGTTATTSGSPTASIVPPLSLPSVPNVTAAPPAPLQQFSPPPSPTVQPSTAVPPPIPPKPPTHHPPPSHPLPLLPPPVVSSTTAHAPDSFSLPDVPSGIQLLGSSPSSSTGGAGSNVSSTSGEPKPPIPSKHFTLPTVEEVSMGVFTTITSLRQRNQSGGQS